MEFLTQHILNLKELLDWRALIDIILIAMGMFFFYRTFLKLGTWKIVLGLLLAIMFSAVAYVLELKGIEWIFSNLSGVALLSLIILFQPELRKIFEKTVSLRRSQKGEEGPEVASLFSDVIFTLAQRRYGAIFVFPGKESIQEWTSEGISLDAKPSIPLILSLFDPHTPGHDGAVIIENGKIHAYSVRLPVSKTERLSKELGTRHHAAMGLSEVTDALVVVVSEERGTVTYFLNGKAKIIQDKSEVLSKILSHWKEIGSYPSLVQKEKKRGVIFAEIAISIISAILFYSTIVITQTEIQERRFTVPIEYIFTSEHLVLTDEPTKIELHLTGPATNLNRINPNQLIVKIDMSEAQPGKQTLLITEENIRLPKRVKLVGTDPHSLEFNVKEIVEREAEIKPQFVGALHKDFKMISVQLNPQEIRIFAPSDNGRQKKIILLTTPIFLQSITEDTTIRCKVIAPPKIKPVDKNWPDVEVKINVDNK